MPKEISKKIKKIEDELTSLQGKVEKNNAIIRESEEHVDRLRLEVHDNELDQVLHCSKGTADLLEITRSSLATSEQTLEDSLLRSEAFSREKVKLESDLLTAQGELLQAESHKLAGLVPDLISSHNRLIQQLYEVDSRLKTIGIAVKERGGKEELQQVDPQIFTLLQQLPCHFVTAEWAKTGTPTLVTLAFTDANKEKIISELLK
jgi:hypothetical protein